MTLTQRWSSWSAISRAVRPLFVEQYRRRLVEVVRGDSVEAEFIEGFSNVGVGVDRSPSLPRRDGKMTPRSLSTMSRDSGTSRAKPADAVAANHYVFRLRLKDQADALCVPRATA